MTPDPDAAPAARVLIIVPTLDEAEHIETCIRSLVEGDPLAAVSPILVVDGRSRDDTRAIVRRLSREFPNLRLADNPARLQAAAVNMALDAEWADRDVLIRCDAHAGYPPRFVSRLVETLRATQAESVAIPMDSHPNGDGAFARAVAWVCDTPLGCGGAAHRGGRISGFVSHGHHAAFRMDAFRRLKGYDTGFPANEDAEYDHRLAGNGGRVWLEASIRIRYYPRPTPGALWRQYRRYGAGRAATLLRHRTMPQLRQMLPVLTLLATVGGLALGLAGNIWGLFPLAAYLSLLGAGSVQVWLIRRSAAAWLAGPAAGIMHVAWASGFISRLTRDLDPRRALAPAPREGAP